MITESLTLESKVPVYVFPGDALNTQRYSLSRIVGRGCWGDVYQGRDTATGETVAVKILNPTPLAQEQMRERNLTPFEAMKNEAGLAACSHVVPRSFEIDESGRPFIVMPYYEKFLSDVLTSGTYSESGISETKLGYIADIARGISEMHKVRKRTHGDLKPDNIAVDEWGKLLLSDLGTSTCSSFGWSISPRDNMGCVYTRAPECFKSGSHPTPRSDNYAWASIAYKLITGEYPLERELDNAKDPEKFFEQLGENGIDNLLKRKIKKNIPRKLRKLIRRNLLYNEFGRNWDGGGLVGELEEIIENWNSWKSVKRHARNSLMYATLPVALVSLAAYCVGTHEPTDLKMPPTRINGFLYPEEKSEEQLEFESEQLDDLPEAVDCMVVQGGTKYAKACTDNRNVAYLVKCHSQAFKFKGGLYVHEYTDNQYQDYAAWKNSNGAFGGGPELYPKGPWHIWAKSIGKSLNLSKKDGKVDLEDVCAISRVGIEKVDEAKRISGSLDYGVYRDAQHSNGDFVIPREERSFIDTWLSYFHADID